MLDQNTDRNIWMIGAVLVGVVMIVLAKGGFSKVFQSILDFFKKAVDSATGKGFDATGVPSGTPHTILASIDWGMIAQHASTILIH